MDDITDSIIISWRDWEQFTNVPCSFSAGPVKLKIATNPYQNKQAVQGHKKAKEREQLAMWGLRPK